MNDTIKTSINEAEGLKALKALVGSRFAARNTLCGSKDQILYMAGDLVTLTSIACACIMNRDLERRLSNSLSGCSRGISA